MVIQCSMIRRVGHWLVHVMAGLDVPSLLEGAEGAGGGAWCSRACATHFLAAQAIAGGRIIFQVLLHSTVSHDTSLDVADPKAEVKSGHPEFVPPPFPACLPYNPPTRGSW